MRELRCSGNVLHAILVDDCTGTIEFRCKSRFCGKQEGVVVLHRFDLGTLEMTTRTYREPKHHTEGRRNGAVQPSAAVRSA